MDAVSVEEAGGGVQVETWQRAHKVVQLTSESCSLSENSEKFAFFFVVVVVNILCAYVVPNQSPGCVVYF